jgi:hypothetical protein
LQHPSDRWVQGRRWAAARKVGAALIELDDRALEFLLAQRIAALLCEADEREERRQRASWIDSNGRRS